MSGAALVVHGGGPTPVLNASLAGVTHEARAHRAIAGLYGARFGLPGLLAEDCCDLFAQPAALLEALAGAPGSALGSSRRPFENGDFDHLLEIFRRRNIRYLFYTGGNGSMGTALEMHRFFKDAGYELCVMGIPKTIDNDIAGTDHTPGYASCARFFAHAARDAGEDNRSLATPVMVLEVLGRNTGWVAAATALARHADDDPPHLIYVPETPLGVDRLCDDVERVFRRLGRVVVAVCEGQRDLDGGWFGADPAAAPGARGQLPANMGHVLARLIWARTGLRSRCERPGLVGRSCSALVSAVDRDESYRCGIAAVQAAMRGQSGKMVSIQRLSRRPYASEMRLTPLEHAANTERRFPAEWILKADISQEFVDWASPLVGPVDPLPRLL